MLDTIKLYTDDFVVNDDANLEIRLADVDYKTGEQNNKPLFLDQGGRWVKSSKAFLDTDRYNLTIKPSSDTGEVFCWVQLLVPKFLTGDNFYPIQEGHAEALPSALERELCEYGISLSAESLKVSWADTFKNIYADKNFTDYAPVFSY